MAKDSPDRDWIDWEDSPVIQSIRTWHRTLTEHYRGERAELRRAHEELDLLNCRGFYRLLDRLQSRGQVEESPLAFAAGAAAHVDDDRTGASVGEVFGSPHGSPQSRGGPRMSEGRFQRLVACEERSELYPLLIRGIRLVERRVPVAELVRDVYWWNEDTRKRWSLDYYQRAPLSEL